MSELEPISSKDLIAAARTRGTLSRTSAKALQQAWVVSEVEDALADSYGIESAGLVLLITIMPDDSGSMLTPLAADALAGSPVSKQQGVIDGHNDLLKGLRASPTRDRILLQTRYLNKTILNPFQPLDLCQDLTVENYPCKYWTPLFEQTIVTLGTVLAKVEELLEQGAAAVRTATLIMTDAIDTGNKPDELRAEVHSVISDMSRFGDHIVAGMGFSSADDQPFREVFKGMGIDPRYIFSADSREEILNAFRVFGTRALELTAGDDSRRVFEG